MADAPPPVSGSPLPVNSSHCWDSALTGGDGAGGITEDFLAWLEVERGGGRGRGGGSGTAWDGLGGGGVVGAGGDTLTDVDAGLMMMTQPFPFQDIPFQGEQNAFAMAAAPVNDGYPHNDSGWLPPAPGLNESSYQAAAAPDMFPGVPDALLTSPSRPRRLLLPGPAPATAPITSIETEASGSGFVSIAPSLGSLTSSPAGYANNSNNKNNTRSSRTSDIHKRSQPLLIAPRPQPAPIAPTLVAAASFAPAAPAAPFPRAGGHLNIMNNNNNNHNSNGNNDNNDDKDDDDDDDDEDDEQEHFLCPEFACYKEFLHCGRLFWHLRTAHGGGTVWHSCPHCGHDLIRRGKGKRINFKRHWLAMCLGRRPTREFVFAGLGRPKGS